MALIIKDKMFSMAGHLNYFENPYKLIVSVDDEFGRYYRSLIPKSHRVQKPMYSSHISTVRKETPLNISAWGKYQNQIINFQYENIIYNDELYYWLNVSSDDLEKIRIELGLPIYSDITKSPDGKHKFHITIANTKHLG